MKRQISSHGQFENKFCENCHRIQREICMKLKAKHEMENARKGENESKKKCPQKHGVTIDFYFKQEIFLFNKSAFVIFQLKRDAC